MRGTRLYLPEPLLAWPLIVFGVLVIAVGTAAAIRLRSQMWSETGSAFQGLINVGRDTWNYWLHDYDGADKWLLGLLMVLRIPAGLALLWGLAGLIF